MVGMGVVDRGTGEGFRSGEGGIGVGGAELFCCMEAAYEGGGGGGILVATPVATPVTIPVVTLVATPHTAPRGTKAGGAPSVGLVGATAWAVCKTGFWTWVDFTDCMMMGEWVLACLADQACIELDLLDPLRMLDTGLGQAGIGLVGEFPLHNPPTPTIG